VPGCEDIVASLEILEALAEDLGEGLRVMFRERPSRATVRSPHGPCDLFAGDEDGCVCGWEFVRHSAEATEPHRAALETLEDGADDLDEDEGGPFVADVRSVPYADLGPPADDRVDPASIEPKEAP
jgi:hypothetical protein